MVARLLAHRVEAEPNEWDVVFSSPRGCLRDPANTSNHVSEVMTDTGHEWANTVCTLLGQAGPSWRDIANYVGHKNASHDGPLREPSHGVRPPRRAADSGPVAAGKPGGYRGISSYSTNDEGP